MSDSFWDQYKHPMWQKKRLECLEDAEYQCQGCGSTSKTLHVHHIRYVKNRKVWEYDVSELIVLCESCHNKEHKIMDDIKTELAIATPATRMAVLGYLQAINDDQVEGGRTVSFLSYEHAAGACDACHISPDEFLAKASELGVPPSLSLVNEMRSSKNKGKQ